MLCGAGNFVEMGLFARSRQEFLQSQLGFTLPAGVPSHDTFNRVFAALDASVLRLSAAMAHPVAAISSL